MFQLAFWLVAFHALCDFAIQPDAMVRGKNRHHAVAAPVGGRHEPNWLHWLGAHAMVHGGGVAAALAICGRADLWWLGLLEAAGHAAIDDLKCDRRITMGQDQALHLACKAAWLAWAVWTAPGLPVF